MKPKRTVIITLCIALSFLCALSLFLYWLLLISIWWNLVWMLINWLWVLFFILAIYLLIRKNAITKEDKLFWMWKVWFIIASIFIIVLWLFMATCWWFFFLIDYLRIASLQLPSIIIWIGAFVLGIYLIRKRQSLSIGEKLKILLAVLSLLFMCIIWELLLFSYSISILS